MNYLININLINIIIVLLFILPLISGYKRGFSAQTIVYTVQSFTDTLEFIGAFIISFYLTKQIFFVQNSFLNKNIYTKIPEIILNILLDNDLVTYLLFVPIFMIFFIIIIRIIMSFLHARLIPKIYDFFNAKIHYWNHNLKSFVGAIWNLPKAIFLIVLISFIFTFLSYFLTSNVFSKQLEDSIIYQNVYNDVVEPVMSSSTLKKVPVIFNNAFAEKQDNFITNLTGNRDTATNNSKFRVIKYFNGVTLDEAVKSNSQIDNLARQLCINKTTSKEKANQIYKWITKNINYDYAKAKRLSSENFNDPSGAIDAFNTKKGVCFDYSALFIAMCRANGIKVNLVTGLGYSGTSWGDHAWNEFYSNEEQRWIRVDTTFGTVMNYFDKRNFTVDHKYDEVQKVWQ